MTDKEKQGKREMLITPEDLEKFMTKENYIKFIEEIKKRSNSKDYKKINKEPIWIKAQW